MCMQVLSDKRLDGSMSGCLGRTSVRGESGEGRKDVGRVSHLELKTRLKCQLGFLAQAGLAAGRELRNRSCYRYLPRQYPNKYSQSHPSVRQTDCFAIPASFFVTPASQSQFAAPGTRLPANPASCPCTKWPNHRRPCYVRQHFPYRRFKGTPRLRPSSYPRPLCRFLSQPPGPGCIELLKTC